MVIFIIIVTDITMTTLCKRLRSKQALRLLFWVFHKHYLNFYIVCNVSQMYIIYSSHPFP